MKTAKDRKRSSVRTETRVAREHGGRRTPRSGAGHIKGDCRTKGKYRIECKETDNLTFRFHGDDWVMLVKEAMKSGEIPIFHITLRDSFGRKHEIAVLRYIDHLGMVKSLESIEE